MSLEEITNITNIEHFIGKDVVITTLNNDMLGGSVEKIFDGFFQVYGIFLLDGIEKPDLLIDAKLIWVNIKNISTIEIWDLDKTEIIEEEKDYFSEEFTPETETEIKKEDEL
jgi:hypothetical protein